MRPLSRYIVIALLFATPFTASAQPINAATASLLTQISQLQLQISQLQSLIAGTSSNQTNPTSSSNCVALTRPLSRGITGAEVSALQRFLADEGVLDRTNVTGTFGPRTEAAVKQWQSSRGIDPTGTVGPKTRAAIASTCKASSDAFRVQSVAAASSQRPPVQPVVAATGTVRDVGNGSTTSAASQATSTLSVSVSPTTAVSGSSLTIQWASTNAPSGSKIRLEAWPEVLPPLSEKNDQGIPNMSAVDVTGQYVWTLPPSTGRSIPDEGVLSTLPPGNYRIHAKLYSGDPCWGYCTYRESRQIHATADSARFTVTGIPGDSSLNASVQCKAPNKKDQKLRINFGNAEIREYAVKAGELMPDPVAEVFPSAPISFSMYVREGSQSPWVESALYTKSTEMNRIYVSSENTKANDYNGLICVVYWQ